MKKKGFTLIELLAVIVILAVIAIISVPIITDLINKSRYGAFGVTKKNIERAAELYHAKNADDLVWEDDISYVTIGTLKTKKFLSNNVVNTLDSTSINDDTKVLLYRSGRKVDYSLQLYDEQFFDWYQGQMVQASKKEGITLPTNVGETVTVDLENLMGKGLVDELRLPLELENRCVGYVEIEKTTDNYEYNAYVDCLQGASTFASHYVSYGGKYLDDFYDIKETSDGGYIAVGRSNTEVITKYGTGNNGKYDASIVKFKSDGNVEWSRNFGGSNNDVFNAVIEVTGGYIAVGEVSSNDGDITNYKGGACDAIIVKYDYNGTLISSKTFGTSGSYDRFMNVELNNNKLIVTGMLSSVANGDLVGITIPSGTSYFGSKFAFDTNLNFIELKGFEFNHSSVFYRSNNSVTAGYAVSGSGQYSNGKKCDTAYNAAGALITHDQDFLNEKYTIFCGAGTTYLYNALEVEDGYIAIGYSTATDVDMAGLSKASNGKYDAIIIKYDKNLENIIWKKSFGGSHDDGFLSIVKANSNEIIVAGYSKSNDMDMAGLSKSNVGYSNAIMVKYDLNNGNVKEKKVFGGTNSERFNSIIKTTSNQYLIAGSSYSVDKDLKNFNKGHNDAIIVKYDQNLNLEKSLKEPVVLIEKLKEITLDYGTSISSKYDNIYTTNDPTKDLKNWCSSYNGVDTYAQNYLYSHCLRPYNTDDMKLLTKIERSTNSVKNVYAGEHEYSIEVEPDQFTNWYKMWFYLINSGEVEISNLKLKFSNGYVGSIREASQNGYISNLVVVSNDLYPTTLHSPDPINIIETNGSTKAQYLNFYLLLKPQKFKLTNLIFTTNKDVTGAAAGFNIQELRNFDMSKIPTE